MAKKPGNAQNKTIHCDICGEDYAATYKRCPFCEGVPPEEQEKRDPGICTPIPSSATYLDFGKERIHVMGHGDPVIDILRQF